MATRRRKVTVNPNPEVQAMEEPHIENFEQAPEFFEENTVVAEPEEQKVIVKASTPQLKEPPKRLDPKKHPRNTPRFARERI